MGLAALNVWQAATREAGPDPELEALHSPEEATRQCRSSMESRFSSRRPSISGLLDTKYLQGGEYQIRGTIELDDGSIRHSHEVVCVAQFRPSEGWSAEEILLDPN